ncbi:MAG: coenzyme F420-0:L-glutamate ligase [Thermoproteota archaeon]
MPSSSLPSQSPLLQVFAIAVPKKWGRFDLADSLEFDFHDGDILVVSSKFVAMSEGRVVKLDSVTPGARARRAAKKFKMDDPRLAQLVLDESDEVVGGIAGFMLTIRKGMIAPNAGIDKSNVPAGYAILYPKDPFKSARDLRQKFKEKGLNVGVVVADSRLMPTRRGTTGVAIACAGFEPTSDERGKQDLFGNRLRVTFRAVADSLATAGVAVMGESSESTPAAVVRGFPVSWTDRRLSWKDLAVPSKIDIYLQGLRRSYKQF